DPAGVWLWQPTGRALPDSCSMDGRAEPARAGTNRVPPAPAARLVPPDDWRGDDRGRSNRKRGAESRRGAGARGEAGGRWCARCAHGAGRPSPDALQMAVFPGVGGVLVAAGGAAALPEVAPRQTRSTRVASRAGHQRAEAATLPVRHVT